MLHPDRLVDASDAERRLAERRMREVNVAWTTLSDPARRTDYDRLLRAQQDAATLAFDAAIAQEKLKAVMGAGEARNFIAVTASPDVEDSSWDIDALVKDALDNRADAKTAGFAVTAAAKRLKLAQLEWFSVAFIADARHVDNRARTARVGGFERFLHAGVLLSGRG